MSGRDLVSEMREGGRVPRATVSRGGVTELLMSLAVVLIIGTVSYLGVSLWLAAQGPPGPPPTMAQLASPHTKTGWTDADTAICELKARSATNAPLPDEMLLANRSVTEGFSGLSARLECYLTLKPTRLCSPEEKAAMIARVNDYLGRVDLVYFGLGLQGAPMRLMGTMLGGEIEGGSAMYDMTKDDTIEFMVSYQKRVATALQKLAVDGIMTPGDFGGFLGMGVPEAITKIFAGVQPKRQLCS